MSSEERLKRIVLRDASFAWWEWDCGTNIVTTNDLKVTMLGYTPDQFKGKGYEAFTDLLHPDDYEKAMGAMRDLLEGRKNIYQVDYRIKDASGRYHWYMDRGVITEFDGDKISRIRGIVIDIGMENEKGLDTEGLLNLLRQFSEDHDKLIVICSVCERIKVREGEWTPTTDEFVSGIADTLSHGICPDCLKRLYPDHAGRVLSRTRAK